MKWRHSSGRTHTRCVAGVVCLLLICADTAAAQTATPSAAPGTSTVPAPYVPLTMDDRWRGYARGMFGPMAWTSGAISAGLGQWRNSPHEWEQGSRGFGLRYG